jgi:hypothetical protein
MQGCMPTVFPAALVYLQLETFAIQSSSQLARSICPETNVIIMVQTYETYTLYSPRPFKTPGDGFPGLAGLDFVSSTFSLGRNAPASWSTT